MPRAIGALQIALLLGVAYFLSCAALTFFAPQSVWNAPQVTSETAARAPSQTTARLDVRFDPFHRDATPVDEVIEFGTDVPETTLNLKLFGRRAGKNGTAILETADRVQKVFKIGDEIMDGVTLKAVNPDYIVLSQGGRIERLTFERETDTLLAAPETETQADTKIATVSAPKPLDVAGFMSAIALSPALSNGKLTGFRISPKNGTVDLASLGLKSGDVIAAIGEFDLTSPSLNPAQLTSKLAGRASVRLKVLRGTDTLFVTLGQ